MTRTAARSSRRADDTWCRRCSCRRAARLASRSIIRGTCALNASLLTLATKSAACSARLVLIVEEPDEDGEIVFQRRYVCDREGTMGEAGAEPNSKFIVEIEYEHEEEDEE